MRLLTLFISICAFNLAFAQTKENHTSKVISIFKEDITIEMRYVGIEGSLHDRGIELFKSDMNELLAKYPENKNKETFRGTTSIRCSFSANGILTINAFKLYPLPYLHPSDNLPQNYIDEFKKSFEELSGRWKPAESDGKIVAGTYSFAVSFSKLDEGPIIINQVDITPTTKRSKNGLDCLSNYKEDNEIMYLFTSAEIDARYIDGLRFLAADINNLLGSIDKDTSNMQPDTCILSFIVDNGGRFRGVSSQQVNYVIDSLILEKLKMLSCNWRPAISSGRPLNELRKYAFNYKYKWIGNSENISNLRLEIVDIESLIVKCFVPK